MPLRSFFLETDSNYYGYYLVTKFVTLCEFDPDYAFDVDVVFDYFDSNVHKVWSLDSADVYQFASNVEDIYPRDYDSSQVNSNVKTEKRDALNTLIVDFYKDYYFKYMNQLYVDATFDVKLNWTRMPVIHNMYLFDEYNFTNIHEMFAEYMAADKIFDYEMGASNVLREHILDFDYISGSDNSNCCFDMSVSFSNWTYMDEFVKDIRTMYDVTVTPTQLCYHL
jgi:hypothetical protein